MTAPATGGGISIRKYIPAKVTLTTGNAYTAAVALSNVKEACALTPSADPHIAVLGCTGSVGYALSHLLAMQGYKLTLIGRSEDRVRTLFPELHSRVKFSGTSRNLLDADIAVILTNDLTASVTPEMFGGPAIVIDVAQPSNIAPLRYSEFAARDIAVFEGGRAPYSGLSLYL